MFHASDQAIAAAHKHSLQIIKIGESMEKLGNRLQKCNLIKQEIIKRGIIEQGIINQEISQSYIQIEQEISQSIELHGKIIQSFSVAAGERKRRMKRLIPGFLHRSKIK